MSKGNKTARALQQQFPGTRYSTILRLVRERGYDGAVTQLMDWQRRLRNVVSTERGEG